MTRATIPQSGCKLSTSASIGRWSFLRVRGRLAAGLGLLPLQPPITGGAVSTAGGRARAPQP